MTYSAVIFDLDGTLLDSMPFYASGWRDAFLERHRVDIGLNAAYEREGAQAEQFVREVAAQHLGRELENLEIEETYAHQRRIFDLAFVPKFFAGWEDLLALPRRYDVPVGLVSGSKRSEIALKTSGVPSFVESFDAIISGEDTATGKPTPVPFLACCERLGRDPKKALVIENAPLGLRAAVAAGMECWIVENGSPLETSWASSLGASRIFHDLGAVHRDLEAALRNSAS